MYGPAILWYLCLELKHVLVQYMKTYSLNLDFYL